MLGYTNYRLRTFTPQELCIDLVSSQTRLDQIYRVFFFDGLLRFIARIVSGPLKRGFVIPKNESYAIEKRQRYVWILGIPFFPAGAYWCVRLTTSGEQFGIPLELKETVRSIPRKFIFPWRSLVFFYAAIVTAGSFFAIESYLREIRHEHMDREQARRADEIREKLRHPVRGQLYEFAIWIKKKGDDFDVNGEVCLRVDSSAGAKTFFSTVVKDFSSWHYQGFYSEDTWTKMFKDSAVVANYAISQPDLSNAVKSQAYYSYQNGKIFPALDPGAYLVLERIIEPE